MRARRPPGRALRVNGTVTVIAEKFQGKRLNSPNDVIVHPDGGIWFTDPRYGITGNYEGSGRTGNAGVGLPRRRQDRANGESGRRHQAQPNGLCFSPDYKRLYIADTGMGRENHGVRDRRHGTAQPEAVRAARCARNRRADVCRRHPLRRRRQHLGGRAPGVQIIAADGERIGMIRLPETCANVCFGGARRNRLFMAASQSLYPSTSKRPAPTSRRRYFPQQHVDRARSAIGPRGVDVGEHSRMLSEALAHARPED